MFAHFRGLGSFMRNAKLKLSVYRDLMRHLNKGVGMRSRMNRKDAFTVCLPCRRMSLAVARSSCRRKQGQVLMTRSMRAGFVRVGTLLGGSCALS